VSGPGPYAVQYDPRAAKELSKLDRTVARRIAKVVKTLGDQPRPQGARPLVGYPGLRRMRVGDYRIAHAIKDAELVILALRVAHRSDVYRNL
jgi:mRNA interferase RelE/StbE